MSALPVSSPEQASANNNGSFAFGPAPSIAMPSGGGTLRSMGDSFAMNNATGTGSYTIPIAVTPGRSAAETSLSLSYSSGGGNGIFGLGWSHSFDMSVSRKTSPSLPQYCDEDESDTFVLTGYGELVPCLVRNGSDFESVYVPADDDYVVKKYRPRLEKSFAQIELWTKKDDLRDTHWRVYSPDNELAIYGRNEKSRIFARDESGPKIFTWLLAEQYDCLGNGRQLLYKAEDSANVDVDQACEQNRVDDVRSRARYLKRIMYGNRKPAAFASFSDTSYAGFMFEIVFDYGEHHVSIPSAQETQSWPAREDPFSSYRSGFEIRQYRQCCRILMFHHIPEELNRSDYLVHATVLSYDGSAHASHLLSLQHVGYQTKTQPRGGEDSVDAEYHTQRLPPLQFEYTAVPTRQQLCDAPLRTSQDEESFTNFASAGLSSSTFVDLLGEGIPGVLASECGEWYYKQNLSPNDNDLSSARDQSIPMRLHLDPLSIVTARPLQHGQGMSLSDVGANGSLDLVCHDQGMHGFFRSRAGPDGGTDTEIGWDDYQPFAAALNVDESDFVRFVDLTGDGNADMLLLLENNFVWHPSLGENGYGPARHVLFDTGDLSRTPILLTQDTEYVHLADMSGDGLVDLVSTRNGAVCYWPNLGYGNFGSAVYMDGCPTFDNDFGFSSANIFLCDIDGSGTADLVYNLDGVVTIYLNSSGNKYETPIVLAAQAPQTQNHNVETVDLFGNGTVCLVWTSDLPSHPGPASLQYIDFTNGVKPHLLCNISNGMGSRTELTYRPSTFYYCKDRVAGKPWITRLPFPVHCVDSTTKHDLVTGRKYVQHFSYHHGTYDHIEREFAGFALVEQWDAEISAVATDKGKGGHWQNGLDTEPAHIKTWYHTGVFTHHDTLTQQLMKEYYGWSGTADDHDSLLQDKIIFDAGDLNAEETRQATYALRGSVLRQELTSLLANSANGTPYTITDHCSDVKVLQPYCRSGVAVVTLVSERETLYTTLEQQSEIAARIAHDMVIERDPYGRATREAHIQYGRADADSRLSSPDQRSQSKTSITYTQTTFSNAVNKPGRAYRLPKILKVQVSDLPAPNIKGIRYGPADIPSPTPRDIVSDTEMQYRSDDLTSLGALLESLALPGAVYRLCITGQMFDDFRPAGETITATAIRETLFAEGKYVDHKQDGNLWTKQTAPTYHPDANASHADERALAQSSFYNVRRVLDGFDNASLVEWDTHLLAPSKIIDPLGNGTTGTVDYRILQMESVVDINGNRKQVVFDALGGVTAVVTSGNDGKGDSIGGLDALLTEQHINDFFARPTACAGALLGQATTRFVSDYWNSSSGHGDNPVRIAQISRAKHASDSLQSPLMIQIQYMDGLGRLLQSKDLAEPERAKPDDERWRCSAWSIVNNKGLVVEQFEPFFDVSAAFVPCQKHGASTLHVYDALDREVVTILPNATWTKQQFSPWSSVHYDASDTLEMQLSKEPLVQSVLSSVPPARYSPSWLEQRLSAPGSKRDTQAALQSKVYGCTPTSTYLDSKSRPFLKRRMLDDSVEIYSRTIFDHNNQPVEVQDTGSRVVSICKYDLLGRHMYQQSIDSGQHWTLLAASGDVLRQYNGRGQRLRYSYDALRRNISVHCRSDRQNATEYMMSKTVYGDNASFNAKGKIVQQMDQSGVTSTPFWDLNGNCLLKEVRLTEAYSEEIDWQRPVKLQDRRYTTATRYDAMSRVTSSIAPDETVIRTTYLTSGLIDEVCVNVRGEKDAKGWKWRAISASRQYDAHGRLTSEVQGNGMLVSMDFDTLTQQISSKTVSKAGVVLQDLRYTRDVNGNVVYISRTSQLPGVTRLQVNADSQYEYDALGRLLKASGREDMAATQGRPDAPGNAVSGTTLNGLKRFTEAYTYDVYSNMVLLDHRIDDPKSPGWSRKMTYGEQTMSGQSFTGNRLVSSSVGKFTETYAYDESGNTISMPHMSKVEWDVSNQMRSASVQINKSGVPETTWYVYNSAGQRVRSVTERSRRSSSGSASKLREHVYIDEYDLYQEYSGLEELRKSCESVHIEEAGSPQVTIEHWSHLNKPLMRFLFKNDQESISLELDENGQEISYEEYSAFGCTTYSRSSKDVPKPFRYAVKRRDRETGLYYYGGRYYAPWLCRWMSADPSGLVDGTNTYLYCAANPANYTDDDGNMLRAVSPATRTAIRSQVIPPDISRRVPYTASQRTSTPLGGSRPNLVTGAQGGVGETRMTVWKPRSSGLVPVPAPSPKLLLPRSIGTDGGTDGGNNGAGIVRRRPDRNEQSHDQTSHSEAISPNYNRNLSDESRKFLQLLLIGIEVSSALTAQGQDSAAGDSPAPTENAKAMAWEQITSLVIRAIVNRFTGISAAYVAKSALSSVAKIAHINGTIPIAGALAAEGLHTGKDEIAKPHNLSNFSEDRGHAETLVSIKRMRSMGDAVGVLGGQAISRSMNYVRQPTQRKP